MYDFTFMDDPYKIFMSFIQAWRTLPFSSEFMEKQIIANIDKSGIPSDKKEAMITKLKELYFFLQSLNNGTPTDTEEQLPD